MSKRSLFLFSFLFVCLGLADLVTTVWGLGLGFVEGDGVFVPFGFSVVGVVCLLFAGFMVRKGLVCGWVDRVVAGLFSVLCCFPVVNNLLLIGSVV